MRLPWWPDEAERAYQSVFLRHDLQLGIVIGSLGTAVFGYLLWTYEFGQHCLALFGGFYCHP